MNFKVCVGCIVFLFFCNSVVSKYEENTLQQLHVIFRHGDKTPEKIGFYPNDPYSNESFWYPYGFGALTNKGKMQAFNVGRALRTRYKNFLGKIYRPDIMYARSTDYDRTKMSLQLVLAGLWPPSPLQSWNVMLPWQPIPYEYEPMDRDKILKFPLSYCKNYYKEYIRAQNSHAVEAFFKEHSEIIEHINKNSGLNCTKTLDLVMIYFALFAEEEYGLKLPEWTENIYPEFLKKSTILEYEIQTYNDIMLKAGGGALVKKIILDCKAKISNTVFKDKKLFLYSGHEFNIVHLLGTLKLFDGKIPPYSSYVVFEFHKINNLYGFKIFYQDYSQNEPKILIIPGCEQFCDFNKFLTLTYNILPEDDTC